MTQKEAEELTELAFIVNKAKIVYDKTHAQSMTSIHLKDEATKILNTAMNNMDEYIKTHQA